MRSHGYADPFDWFITKTGVALAPTGAALRGRPAPVTGMGGKTLQNLDHGLIPCRGSFGSRFEYALRLCVFLAAHGPAALDIAARIRYNNTRTARP